MARIMKHGENDWCHICGNREVNLADIDYPENAEHEVRPGKYIRICSDCGVLITRVGLGHLKETYTDPPLHAAMTEVDVLRKYSEALRNQKRRPSPLAALRVKVAKDEAGI